MTITRTLARLAAALVLAAAPFAAAPLAAQGAVSTAAGVRLFDSGRFAEAKAQLTAAAQANPQDGTAAFYLGRIALAEGDGDAAARWLERATRLEPRNSSYYFWLGNAYGRQALRTSKIRQARLAGRIRGAYEKAVALDPDNLDARSGLLQYYVVAPGFMGGSVSKAREQAREIGARSAFRGRLANAVIAERQKDMATAEREYAAAVDAAPDSAIAYAALGDLYRRTGRYDQAFATFGRMRRALPNEASALYLIGRTSAVSGERLDEGERALKAFIAGPRKPTDPPLASAHFRLGAIYEKQNRRDLARQEYETTLKLDPDQGEAKAGLRRVR